jgi:hypothetical protein
MEQELKIRGYVDPRTGEYKIAREANAAEVEADLGFIMAWKFYWDGPLTAGVWSRDGSEWVEKKGGPVYDRESWLASDERQAWLDALSTEQREMLEDSFPPEEVPALAADGVEG